MILLGLALIVVATLLNELENVVDKRQFAKHHLTHYTIGFLTAISGAVLFGVIIYFSDGFVFSTESWPTLSLRIGLEIVLSTLSIRAILIANLSTVSLFKMLTIPGLLVVDVILGYTLGFGQIIGISLLFGAMLILTLDKSINKTGAGILTVNAFVAVATTTLFKYNIENYNSVATEQFIVLGALLLYFAIQMLRHSERPVKTLRKVWAEEVVAFSGFSTVLNSFALGLLPPSLMITFKRAGSMLWALILGRKVFHEQHIMRKVIAGVVAISGVILLAV